MNYIRYFLLLFMPIYVVGQGAQTVPCPPTGVTTNPLSPVALHPSYENNFDWTANQYQALATNQSFYQVNPYFASGTPVAHLSPNTFRDDSPEQGWELVFYDLGYDINNNELLSGAGSGHLYIVMYNKYRSLVRVFVAIVPDNPGNIVEISLKTNSPQATALLAAVDKVQAPLNEFDRAVTASNAQRFVSGSPGQYQWHYADFPVAYDPCTCTLPDGVTSGTAKLTIIADVNDEADIRLLGVSAGNIKVDKPASGPVNQENWNDFYGTVKKTGDLISVGKKGYKSFDVFKADVESTAKGKEKETEMKSGVANIANFLVDIAPLLSKVPYVAEGLAIIDFFIGGGEKSSAVKLPPMSIQLEHEFTGTLTFFDRYFSHDIYIPGSNFSPNSIAQNLDRSYPLYNEILGLYNLLERPKVEIWTGNAYYEEEVITDYNGNILSSVIQNNKKRRAFKIDQSSIKLALNPASNLTISEAFVQLTFKKNGGQLGFSQDIEGFEINRDTWVSPLVPLACAGERLLYTDMGLLPYTQLPGSEPEEILTDEVLISIVLSLKSPNGNKYLHKATFPVEVTSENQYIYSSDEVIVDHLNNGETISSHTFNWFNKPEFENYQRSLVSAPTSLTFNNQIIDENQSAQTSIDLINTKVLNNATGPLFLSEYTTLKSRDRIFLDAGSQLEKNTELEIVGLIEQNCNAPLPLASPQQIAATCSSTSYMNSSKLTLGKMSTAVNYFRVQNSIDLYPNPASNYLKIDLSSYDVPVESVQVFVHDFSGRIVLKENLSPESYNQFRVNIEKLSVGVYLIRVKIADYVITEQFKIN